MQRTSELAKYVGVCAGILVLSACGGGGAQPAVTVTSTVTAAPESIAAASPTPTPSTVDSEQADDVAGDAGFWIWSEDEIDQIGPELWVYGDPMANTSSNTAESLLPVLQYDMDYDCKPKVTSSEFVPDMIHCGREGVIACFDTPEEAFQHAREMMGFSDGVDVRLVIGNCNMSVPRANTTAAIVERLDQTAYLMPFLVANQELS